MSAQNSEPQRIANRYSLLEKLGAGGMGAVYCAQQAARLLGHPVPHQKAVLGITILGQIARQLLPSWLRRTGDRSAALEAAIVYDQLFHFYFVAGADGPLILNAALHSVNLAEAIGPSAQLATAYALIGGFSGFFSLHRVAQMYLRRARETAYALNDPVALKGGLQGNGAYYTYTGHWDLSQTYLQQTIDAARQVGDWRIWEESSFFMISAQISRGVAVYNTPVLEELHQMSTLLGHEAMQYTSAGAKIWLLLRQGRIDDIDLSEMSLPDHAQAFDLPSQVTVAANQLITHWRRGELPLAREYAQKVIPLINQVQFPLFVYLPAYTFSAEACFGLWENGENKTADHEISLQLLQALRSFARTQPIVRPAAHRYDGLADWLDGKPGGAHKHWQKALAEAIRLDMPYEQGMAHYEIGRHLPQTDSQRHEHLTQAMAIFERLGAAWELAQAGMIADQHRRDDA